MKTVITCTCQFVDFRLQASPQVFSPIQMDFYSTLSVCACIFQLGSSAYIQSISFYISAALPYTELKLCLYMYCEGFTEEHVHTYTKILFYETKLNNKKKRLFSIFEFWSEKDSQNPLSENIWLCWKIKQEFLPDFMQCCRNACKLAHSFIFFSA